MLASKRILEPEIMESLEEVYAYDKLTNQYLGILHNGFVETIINKSASEGNFLEVGSGTGRISLGIAKYTNDIELTGIDLSDNMIHVARHNCNKMQLESKVSFKKGSATEIPFEDNSFDTVLSHNMLHHLPDPIQMIVEMKRVVKKSGGIFIRDLIRQPPLLLPLHVHILGIRYNALMKKEYSDSIKAALSKNEWKQLFENSNIDNAIITNSFITHQSIEKEALNKRSDYIKVPTPFHLKPIKNMYVSKLKT